MGLFLLKVPEEQGTDNSRKLYLLAGGFGVGERGTE